MAKSAYKKVQKGAERSVLDIKISGVCDLCIRASGTRVFPRPISLEVNLTVSVGEDRECQVWLVSTHSLAWQEQFWIIELQWSSTERSVLCHVAAHIR